MKTKNIFKLLALALLMPAMLLTTACSSSDDDTIVNNPETTESIAKKGYPLHVTVNVTREGDEGDDTRASYDDGTKKLSFSNGDMLFVKRSYSITSNAAGDFAGLLEMTSPGTFSGIIYTENNWTGSTEDLLTEGQAFANLVPYGYSSYGFRVIDSDIKYDSYVANDYSKTFAPTKATAVEQFSYEYALYTSGTGFVLAPRNAILNFTITDLTANTDVSVYFKYGNYVNPNEISGTVKTDASGNATFAIGVKGFEGEKTDLNTCTFKVNGNTISLVNGSKILEGGKIYNITRSAGLPDGVLAGKFTINSSGSKVRFSKGNLRASYNNSTWTWSFFPNQWDYVGHDANNTSITGNGTVSTGSDYLYVDLFGWSTNSTYYGIHNSTSYGAYSGTFSDWGANVSTSDPVWRTLTSDEWNYIFSTRTTGGTVGSTAQACYTMATIRTDVSDGVKGVILFPDGINFAASEFTTLGTVNGASAYATKCTSDQWTALADKGCVFLPATGEREGITVTHAGSYGHYWSSSPYNEIGAYAVKFESGIFYPQNPHYRNFGFSVRLVRAVE